MESYKKKHKLAHAKTIFLTLVLIFNITFVYAKNQLTTSDILKKIPFKDKKKLDNFFKLLIVDNAFGYTLFGEKPLVVTDFSTSATLNERPTNSQIFEGWKTWEKYRHLFPRQHFSLNCIENYNSSKEKYQTIVLFNLKQLKHYFKSRNPNIPKRAHGNIEYLFKKNFISFKFNDRKAKILFSHQSEPSKFVKKIHQLFKNSEISPKEHLILGILLGYGKRNAERFARFNDIFNTLIELPYFPQKVPEEFDILNDFTKENLFYTKEHRLQKPMLDADYTNRIQASASQMITESNLLTKKWQSLSQIYPDGPMTLVRLPVFVADADLPETKKLYQKYDEVRNYIMILLQEPNFLEIVLTKYCEG
jgi:hypothetical protein